MYHLLLRDCHDTLQLVIRHSWPRFALTVSLGKTKIILLLSFLFSGGRKAQLMHRYTLAFLCFVSLLASAAHGQSPAVAPVRVAAGTVLNFHLQTRLNPTAGDTLDALPKGTVLQVRILDSIDSSVDRDGSGFHGSLVAPLILEGEVIVRSEAEVRGLLVLLRSRSHPDGFRYELLVTGLTDRGKSFDLTASLNPSFLDFGTQPAPGSKSATK